MLMRLRIMAIFLIGLFLLTIHPLSYQTKINIDISKADAATSKDNSDSISSDLLKPSPFPIYHPYLAINKIYPIIVDKNILYILSGNSIIYNYKAVDQFKRLLVVNKNALLGVIGSKLEGIQIPEDMNNPKFKEGFEIPFNGIYDYIEPKIADDNYIYGIGATTSSINQLTGSLWAYRIEDDSYGQGYQLAWNGGIIALNSKIQLSGDYLFANGSNGNTVSVFKAKEGPRSLYDVYIAHDVMPHEYGSPFTVAGETIVGGGIEKKKLMQ